MKIELDLTNKTIKIAEGCNLDKLMENLEMLLPNGKWKEFKLLINVQINWTSAPYVIQPYVSPYIGRPWYESYPSYLSGKQLLTEVNYGTTNSSGNIDSLNSTGTYQVEVKN